MRRLVDLGLLQVWWSEGGAHSEACEYLALCLGCGYKPPALKREVQGHAEPLRYSPHAVLPEDVDAAPAPAEVLDVADPEPAEVVVDVADAIEVPALPPATTERLVEAWAEQVGGIDLARSYLEGMSPRDRWGLVATLLHEEPPPLVVRPAPDPARTARHLVTDYLRRWGILRPAVSPVVSHQGQRRRPTSATSPAPARPVRSATIRRWRRSTSGAADGIRGKLDARRLRRSLGPRSSSGSRPSVRRPARRP